MTSRATIVTGGTQGIGRAVAVMLRDAGYHVASVHWGGGETAQAFHAETGIPTYEWDVSDFDACHEGVKRVVADLGPIEVLVNNAGITRDGTLHKMTPERWNSVIATDLSGCFNMCHAVIGTMREKGFGRIVNVSSVNGLMGQFGQTNYCAAKAGVIGFTKSLALEGAAKGITVNAVAPGYTDTPMVGVMPKEILDGIVARVPVGRLAKPEEIARGIMFLVADESSFITGTTLSINGGLYMS